jgi:hypothetical protein
VARGCGSAVLRPFSEAGRSRQPKKRLDDQTQHAGNDDAVHPLQEIDLRSNHREFLVEADDVLTGAVDLVLYAWQLPGLLLDALEAIMADDQTTGRGARSRQPPSTRHTVRRASCSKGISGTGILGWSADLSK